jgi:hypothetical protein
MARQGLNCSLSYVDAGKTKRVYKVRVDQYTRGSVMVFEESQARTRRAFFPHRRAEDQFTINVILIGQAERRSFTSWLMGYCNYVLDTDLTAGTFPAMTMVLPSRPDASGNTIRYGIPLTGVEWGDHVGSMVWNHAVIFESVPAQMAVSKTSRPLNVNAGTDPANEYFYPSQTQLSGNQKPFVYTDVVTALADSTNQDAAATLAGLTGG